MQGSRQQEEETAQEILDFIIFLFDWNKTKTRCSCVVYIVFAFWNFRKIWVENLCVITVTLGSACPLSL